MYSDTECNGNEIRSVYLSKNAVLLENNSRCSYDQVFDCIRQQI
jgi:hypothetical protein